MQNSNCPMTGKKEVKRVTHVLVNSCGKVTCN